MYIIGSCTKEYIMLLISIIHSLYLSNTGAMKISNLLKVEERIADKGFITKQGLRKKLTWVIFLLTGMHRRIVKSSPEF